MAEAAKQEITVLDIRAKADFHEGVNSGILAKAEHSYTVKQETTKQDEYRNLLQHLPKS